MQTIVDFEATHGASDLYASLADDVVDPSLKHQSFTIEDFSKQRLHNFFFLSLTANLHSIH